MQLNPAQAVFSQLLLSGTLVHEGSFRDLQEACGISIHPRIVMVVSVDLYPDLVDGKPIRWRKEIGQRVSDGVREAMTVPHTRMWVEEGVLAVLADPGPRERWRQTADRLARRILRCCEDRGVRVSVGIGGCFDNPHLLHRSFKEAKEAMVDRFFQGTSLIFHYEPKQPRPESPESPVTNMERAELAATLRIGDADGTCSLLGDLLEKLADAYRHDVDMFKSEAVELVVFLSRQVLESGANPAEILAEHARFIQDLFGTIRYDKFVRKVCEYAGKLCGMVQPHPPDDVSPVIRKAILYLKKHLREKISLEQLAQSCCLSAWHLSHRFKRETGIPPMEFLNRLRLEKAAHFLEHTDCTIREIAGLVGFEDPNYFSRTFKKMSGITPSEYRKTKSCESSPKSVSERRFLFL
ncbi:helix-turn-helix domain-containing protein [Staphylospora marina]|uniref:helix-turn-helix domain-containing protein n=1 Tax=Staphylospora marina TaxID=2490858 RepID=UPI000F5BE51C|nr:helix-turn-helix domain-containing protein [Staphylospora marina]